MSKVMVSFIIPVYNAEQYLSCCLDSITRQTVTDIEIICINDCSPDNSQSILESYAAKDPRIKLIHFKENKGPGPARNAGLEAVSGKFIRMVDADDFIPPGSTEILLNAAQQYHSDFVRGGFKSCSTSGEILQKGWNYPNELTINTSIKEEKRLWHFDQHWVYLYRAETLLASGAKYDESMRNGQDAAFLTDLMPYLNKVTFIPETVYFYRDNPASTMHRRRDKDFYLNVFNLYKRVYLRLESIQLREAADNIFYRALCYYLPNKILSSIPDDLNHKDSIEILSDFSDLLTKQHGKELGFSHMYKWKTEQAMPWPSKYLLLLLCEGYLEDAYNDLKRINHDKKYAHELQTNNTTCKHELSAVYSSSSWKVTTPLRKISSFFQRKGPA